MRLFPVLFLAGWLAVGCSAPTVTQDGTQPAPKSKAKPATPPKSAKSPPPTGPVIEPVAAFTGKIVLVNPGLKYVVIEGVIGRLPPTETALNVYRDGQKVGAVVVSNQARGANFAADVSQGEARVGDTVRSD